MPKSPQEIAGLGKKIYDALRTAGPSYNGLIELGKAVYANLPLDSEKVPDLVPVYLFKVARELDQVLSAEALPAPSNGTPEKKEGLTADDVVEPAQAPAEAAQVAPPAASPGPDGAKKKPRQVIEVSAEVAAKPTPPTEPATQARPTPPTQPAPPAKPTPPTQPAPPAEPAQAQPASAPVVGQGE